MVFIFFDIFDRISLVKKVKKRVYICTIIGLIIDLITKLFISSKLDVGQSKIIIDKFFNITLVHNTGGAFGLFHNSAYLLLLVSIVFLIIFIYYIEKNKTSNMEEVCYGFILAGIMGNMIDRLIRGYVIDFFDFYIFGYDYPVFNFADIFIVVGIILMIFIYIKEIIWKKD